MKNWTWRPSVGEIVEVVHHGKSWTARVRDVERPGTHQERYWLVRDWDLPQFSGMYAIGEIKRVPEK